MLFISYKKDGIVQKSQGVKGGIKRGNMSLSLSVKIRYFSGFFQYFKRIRNNGDDSSFVFLKNEGIF
jgi:hypothetical protein